MLRWMTMGLESGAMVGIAKNWNMHAEHTGTLIYVHLCRNKNLEMTVTEFFTKITHNLLLRVINS